jgi:hypothetical protein
MNSEESYSADMFVDVDETVEVVAVFKKDRALPVLLRWGGREYKIKSIDFVHKTHEGETLIHRFAVSDSSNSFKLSFNTASLRWNLEQVYLEG